jgi:hypothetical protein
MSIGFWIQIPCVASRQDASAGPGSSEMPGKRNPSSFLYEERNAWKIKRLEYQVISGSGLQARAVLYPENPNGPDKLMTHQA